MALFSLWEGGLSRLDRYLQLADWSGNTQSSYWMVSSFSLSFLYRSVRESLLYKKFCYQKMPSLLATITTKYGNSAQHSHCCAWRSGGWEDTLHSSLPSTNESNGATAPTGGSD